MDYGIESRRKWVEKMYPYIFFNEDRESMTFFGIHITDDKEQAKETYFQRETADW